MTIKVEKEKTRQNALQPTSGFTQAGVYARRQFCGILEVYRPPEPLWNPRLREAATTLHASGGQRSGKRQNKRLIINKTFRKRTEVKRKKYDN